MILRYTLPTALVLTALTACSGQMDQEEATGAAIKAASLFKVEFQKAAPPLTETTLQKALEARIDTLDERDSEPRLTSAYFESRKPVFVTLDGATPEIDAVKQVCATLQNHDISPKPYPCEEFDALVKEIDAEKGVVSSLIEETRLEEAHIDRLRAHLMTLEAEKIRDPEGAVLDETLVAIMFGRGGFDTPLPHIEQQITDLSIRNTALARAMSKLEVTSHQILMRFAWDMRARHAHKHWQTVETQRAWLANLADEEERRTKQPQDRLRMDVPADWPKSPEGARKQSIQTIMAQVGQRPAAQIMAGLIPGGDQYDRVTKALATYREFDAKGGFTQVPKSALKAKKGRPHDAVPALRKRLSEEGYAPGTGSPKDARIFDGVLADTLEAFQEAHQLRSNGKMDKATLAALNRPVSEKVTALRLALHKWREAVPRPDKYVYINIPDFHGELWVDGKRNHRYRVVVGDRKRKYNRKEGGRLVNATPVTMALIDRIVYNPYWNVPKRIFQTEILRGDSKEMEDEDRKTYLETKGFEVMAFGKGGEWVRQPPGPGNALGKVKIIFPNPHETYMHDTRSKNLFARPVRAFSHGCIRVHEPLDLARKLLEADGQYDRDRIGYLERNWKNQTVLLQDQIPVYLDYITTRVDESGRVHFLSDIYDYDKDSLARLASRQDR